MPDQDSACWVYYNNLLFVLTVYLNFAASISKTNVGFCMLAIEQAVYGKPLKRITPDLGNDLIANTVPSYEHSWMTPSTQPVGALNSGLQGGLFDSALRAIEAKYRNSGALVVWPRPSGPAAIYRTGVCYETAERRGESVNTSRPSVYSTVAFPREDQWSAGLFAEAHKIKQVLVRYGSNYQKPAEPLKLENVRPGATPLQDVHPHAWGMAANIVFGSVNSATRFGPKSFDTEEDFMRMISHAVVIAEKLRPGSSKRLLVSYGLTQVGVQSLYSTQDRLKGDIVGIHFTLSENDVPAFMPVPDIIAKLPLTTTLDDAMDVQIRSFAAAGQANSRGHARSGHNRFDM